MESSSHAYGFNILPQVIYEYIWRLACPELCNHPLILAVKVGPMGTNPQHHAAHGTASLGLSAKRLSKALQLHARSRRIVTRALPDTLAVAWSNEKTTTLTQVRFRKERDLVCLESIAPADHEASLISYHLRGFSSKVRNIVVAGPDVNTLDRRWVTFLTKLPHLRRVYYYDMATFSIPLGDGSLPWFASSSCHVVRLDDLVCCWPKEQHESEIPSIPYGIARWEFALLQGAKTGSWKLLPMIVFGRGMGEKRFIKLVTTGRDVSPLREEITNIERVSSPDDGYDSCSDSTDSGERVDGESLETAWWDEMARWARQVDDEEMMGWARRTDIPDWNMWADYAEERHDAYFASLREEARRAA